MVVSYWWAAEQDSLTPHPQLKRGRKHNIKKAHGMRYRQGDQSPITVTDEMDSAYGRLMSFIVS